MSAMLLTDLALANEPEVPNFLLARLASLVARQAATASQSEREGLGMEVFTAFLDCTDIGFGAQAQAIVEQLRPESAVGERLAA